MRSLRRLRRRARCLRRGHLTYLTHARDGVTVWESCSRCGRLRPQERLHLHPSS